MNATPAGPAVRRSNATAPGRRCLLAWMWIMVSFTFTLTGVSPAEAKPQEKKSRDPGPNAGSSVGAGGDAPPADVGALLAKFAAAPGISARFREEKQLAMLDAPLINEGTIHFAPPGRLARHTERPLASTVLIDENRVQFGDADGEHSLDLRTNPVARLFVDSFVMILAGNRAGLERLFEMRFTPAAAGPGWRLTLAPRVSPMNKVVKDIVVAGERIVIRQVEIRETSGDWTRTTFSAVDVNHRYTPEEQARVFRLPPRQPAKPTTTTKPTPPAAAPAPAR